MLCFRLCLLPEFPVWCCLGDATPPAGGAPPRGGGGGGACPPRVWLHGPMMGLHLLHVLQQLRASCRVSDLCSVFHIQHKQNLHILQTAIAVLEALVETPMLLCCRSLTLHIQNIKKSRTVRQVHVYHCAHPIAELSEMKTHPALWHKVEICSTVIRDTGSFVCWCCSSLLILLTVNQHDLVKEFDCQAPGGNLSQGSATSPLYG